MNWRIALKGEYLLSLQGLYDSLKLVPDFEIVGAFTGEEELLACLDEKAVDMLVINLLAKDNSEIQLLEKIHSLQSGKIKVIALVSGQYDKLLQLRELEVGVKAFLPKDTSANELISAIITVGKGNTIVPERLVEDQHSPILSDMELKVLALVVQEYTNDRIAKQLYISRRTVETYVSSLCGKLGVDSRIGAVREAVRLNLVSGQ